MWLRWDRTGLVQENGEISFSLLITPFDFGAAKHIPQTSHAMCVSFVARRVHTQRSPCSSQEGGQTRKKKYGGKARKKKARVALFSSEQACSLSSVGVTTIHYEPRSLFCFVCDHISPSTYSRSDNSALPSSCEDLWRKGGLLRNR